MFDPHGDLIPDTRRPCGKCGSLLHYDWQCGAPVPHDHTIAPGEVCTTCKRKVPHPRKESSPTSKTFSYRVPTDEAEAHQDTLDVVARYVGVAEQPFSQFKLLSLALALVLQDDSLRGFAQRSAA